MSQNQDEPVKLYVARLKGKAATCDFTLPRGETDYTAQIVQHQLIKGISDPQIQEHVLAHAATNEGSSMDLAERINLIEAKECGKLDTESPQKSSRVNKVTDFKKVVKSSDFCDYCGYSGHGKHPDEKTRKKLCPAFSKTCNKCKEKGHFRSQCKKNSKAVKSVECKTNEDSSDDESSSSDGHRGTVYGMGQFCGVSGS